MICCEYQFVLISDICLNYGNDKWLSMRTAICCYVNILCDVTKRLLLVIHFVYKIIENGYHRYQFLRFQMA